MPIIGLPNGSLSRSKQMAGGKEWVKELTGVDTSKQDAFAFLGWFRQFRETVEVPEGTWYLSYYRDMSTSGGERGHLVQLFRVTGETLVKVKGWSLDPGKGWVLKIRDEIAKILADAAKAAGGESMPGVLCVRDGDVVFELTDTPLGGYDLRRTLESRPEASGEFKGMGISELRVLQELLAEKLFGYEEGPVTPSKPHCRAHLEFRSNCSACEQENASS